MTTVKQLSQQTGLTVSYIRKCLDYLANLLKRHTHRGTHNAVMIDSNGLVIFERIAQLKQDGLALPEIQRTLETDIETGTLDISRPGETESKTPGTQEHQVLTELLTTQARLNDEMTARLADVREHEERLRTEQQRYFREVQEKEREIADLQRKVDSLDTALKMLPDGKPPEQIRSEYEQQRRELADKARKEHESAAIVAELQQSQGLFQGKKRRELLERLNTLLS